MICKCCNAENQDGARFCNACGSPLMDIDSSDAISVKGKGKSVKIATFIAAVCVLFVVLFAFGFFSNSAENKIKGTWTRDNTGLETSEIITYTFTSKGGTNTYSAEKTNFVSKNAEFDWYVTDDDELIILWSNTSCTKYTWNPDFENYPISSNEYNWYIKGNKLYLSTTSSETGYFVYTK